MAVLVACFGVCMFPIPRWTECKSPILFVDVSI